MSLTLPLLAELKQEAGKTRKCLERLSQDHFNWKPHPKSMALIQLASHIAALNNWIPRMMEGEVFDMLVSGSVSRPEPPADTAALLQQFDENLAKAIATLESAMDDQLRQHWTFKRGDHIIANLPRIQIIRFLVLSHSVHHRGQLSVYMRLLDIAVPSIYGPSADESF